MGTTAVNVSKMVHLIVSSGIQFRKFCSILNAEMHIFFKQITVETIAESAFSSDSLQFGFAEHKLNWNHQSYGPFFGQIMQKTFNEAQ